MQVERIRLAPLLRKPLRSLRIGFKEQQQRVHCPARTHVGILHHTLHALLVRRLVAVGGHDIHATALVERHREQSSLMRQHLVELNLLADTNEPYRRQVLLPHLHVTLGGTRVSLAVVPRLNLVQPFRHVGVSQLRILPCLPRGPHRRSGNILIRLPQSVILPEQPLVQAVAQQRLQRHRLFLLQIPKELLRSVPPCRRHQRDDFILCGDKHSRVFLSAR